MPAKLKISEADVQQAVVLMLELDGWRAIRTDPVSDRSRGKGFGEVGMPDYLFIRYGNYQNTATWKSMEEQRSERFPCADAEVLWIEFKAPGKKPKPHQCNWMVKENARGALIMVCDSVDDFREWYKISGLMRHQILS
jgi:hypothetical protein